MLNLKILKNLISVWVLSRESEVVFPVKRKMWKFNFFVVTMINGSIRIGLWWSMNNNHSFSIESFNFNERLAIIWMKFLILYFNFKNDFKYEADHVKLAYLYWEQNVTELLWENTFDFSIFQFVLKQFERIQFFGLLWTL